MLKYLSEQIVFILGQALASTVPHTVLRTLVLPNSKSTITFAPQEARKFSETIGYVIKPSAQS